MGKRKRYSDPDRIKRKIRRLQQRLADCSATSDDNVSDYEGYRTDNQVGMHNSEDSDIEHSETGRVKSVIASSDPVPGPSSGPTEVSDLSAQILDALGGTKEKEEVLGPKIPEEISKRWGRILVDGLSKEQKQEMGEKFLIPENFKLLKAPMLNPEISAVLSESARQRDKRLEKAQNMLGLGLAGLSSLTNSLISSEMEKIDIIKKVSDVSQLLADLHCENTISRRKIILPSLDKKFSNMIQFVNRDTYLFGENLGEKINSSKSAEKSGLQIKRSYTVNTTAPSTSKKYTPRQGNWRGPPKSQGHQTKQGGPRNRPPQSSARKTSDKYAATTKSSSRTSRRH